ncbi:hypothetical protein [Bremerella sp. P1]|uniref:hypothetical protein n=1 Tax=Bremerella sp. P1 TaxID=3026424 RepID=UPI0023683765|nr:hypothetical protein [Bremerella sp. P1]WDI44746.1 hypothetical protein PSR63_12450 [Bremerella sp. P1]
MDRKQMGEFLGYNSPGPYYRMEDYLDPKKRGTRHVHAPNIQRMWDVCTSLDLDFYEMISCELDFSDFDTTAYLLQMMKKKRAVDLYKERTRDRGYDKK